MKRKKLKGTLFLLITAIIWGSAFVAQSEAMKVLGAFTFNATRMLLGGLVLIPVMLVMKKVSPPAERRDPKDLVIGGAVCGAALALASAAQNYAFVFPGTTVGKAGFITALYVVLVPLISAVFLKRKLHFITAVCIALAVGGLYLLCMTEKLVLSSGDLMLLLCALLFSVQILAVDRFLPKVDPVALSCLQFFFASFFSFIFAFIFERGDLSFAVLKEASLSILYAGILSCGVAYTLQVVGQKFVEPTLASLLMSLESVFAVLSGLVILGERLSLRELLGCLLMFAAVLLSEIPIGKKKAE